MLPIIEFQYNRNQQEYHATQKHQSSLQYYFMVLCHQWYSTVQSYISSYTVSYYTFEVEATDRIGPSALLFLQNIYRSNGGSYNHEGRMSKINLQHTTRSDGTVRKPHGLH